MTYLDQLKNQVLSDIRARQQELDGLRRRMADLDAELPELELAARLIGGLCGVCGKSLNEDPRLHQSCYVR